MPPSIVMLRHMFYYMQCQRTEKIAKDKLAGCEKTKPKEIQLVHTNKTYK